MSYNKLKHPLASSNLPSQDRVGFARWVDRYRRLAAPRYADHPAFFGNDKRLRVGMLRQSQRGAVARAATGNLMGVGRDRQVPA